MAFNSFNGGTRNSNNNARPEREQAAGFINYYLRGKNGRMKVGVMPLRDSVPREFKLREWLENNEQAAETFMSNLEVVYQPNNGGQDFELPV